MEWKLRAKSECTPSPCDNIKKEPIRCHASLLACCYVVSDSIQGITIRVGVSEHTSKITGRHSASHSAESLNMFMNILAWGPLGKSFSRQ